MRKRKSLGVPVKVYNLGSPAGTQMDFGRRELWNRMDAEMGRKAISIPVFLVNEKQIDTLYPPRSRRALDPECVRELLQEISKEREIDFIFERLKRCEEKGWEKYEKVVAVGLYINPKSKGKLVLGLGDSSVLTHQAYDAFLQHDGPAIFLCCERIMDWANSLGVSHHLVMDKVYYHELGHAIMDTLPMDAPDPYLEQWGRIVEESLANAIAYRCFKGKEARWVQKLIQTQPAEYLGYFVVNEVLPYSDRFTRYIDLCPCWWLDRFLKYAFEDMKTYYGYPITVSLLLKRRFDSLNIACWKHFKKTIKNANQYQLQIWKAFAIYLLKASLD